MATAQQAPNPAIGFDVPRAPAPFLVLDQDRLFVLSAYGQAIRAQNDAEAEALRAESKRLDAQFEKEERAITDRRAELSTEEFRALANAFDERVTEARRTQDERAQALAARTERRRSDFFRRAAPVLLQILTERGASAVVEQGSVLVANQDLNITDEAIKRLDAAYAEDRPDLGQGKE